MSKIYVATSWRNARQLHVVITLRNAGHEVYDFKDSEGFYWSDIDRDWESWSLHEYIDKLSHPLAKKGFQHDFDAMYWADTFVGVLPFGRSASLEMGWAVGRCKRTFLLLADGEPELMVKMIDHLCVDVEEVLDILGRC